MKNRFGILGKVMLPTIALVLFIMGISTWISYSSSQKALQDSVSNEMNHKALSLVKQLDAWMQRNILDVKLMATEQSFINALQKSFMGKAARKIASKRMAELVEEYKIFESLNLFDSQRKIIASSNQDFVNQVIGGDHKEFILESNDQLQISGMVTSAKNKTPVFGISLPMEGKGGEKGVFSAIVNLDAFNRVFIDSTKIAETGFAFMVNRDGFYLDHPNKKYILKKSIGEDQYGKNILLGKNGFTKYLSDGIDHFAAYAEYNPKGWIVVISAPVNEVFRSAFHIRNVQIGVALVGITFLAFGTWFLLQKIVIKPVSRTTEIMESASKQVANSAAQISTSSQMLAEGATEQAASIEETSSSLEEMSSMTRQNAGNSAQADALMKDTVKVVNEANKSMSQLTESMAQISSASEETSKIIKTIDEIAFQTNLLALNAAVEAARAGEAGAGFAVVADEVRNLALRAAEAAKNTAGLIQGTVKKIADGRSLVENTNEKFEHVSESATKVGSLIAEIAAASSEQAQGTEQVNNAVVEMDKVTQQTAASAQESASASQELNSQSERMASMVEELFAMISGGKKLKPNQPNLPMGEGQLQLHQNDILDL